MHFRVYFLFLTFFVLMSSFRIRKSGQPTIQFILEKRYDSKLRDILCRKQRKQTLFVTFQVKTTLYNKFISKKRTLVQKKNYQETKLSTKMSKCRKRSIEMSNSIQHATCNKRRIREKRVKTNKLKYEKKPTADLR